MQPNWYFNGQSWVPGYGGYGYGGGYGGQAVVAAGDNFDFMEALMGRLLLDADPKLRNQGVIARADKIGAFWNDFKAQWNLQFPANPITETDYDPKAFIN